MIPFIRNARKLIYRDRKQINVVASDLSGGRDCKGS